MKNLYISIIIPIKDSADKLQTTINSLFQDVALSKIPYEIIIANDNASKDISKYVIEKAKSGIHITEVKIYKSKGAYFARNKAIEKACGNVLIFFDAPLVIGKKWFFKLLPYFDDYDYIAGEVKMVKKINMNLGEKFDYIKAFPSKIYFENEHYGVTAYLAVKKNVFDKIGFFLEVQSGGDNEFGRRVFKAGFKQYYFDKVPAFHAPRNFHQQYLKIRRDIKGVYDLHKLLPDKYPNPLTLRRLLVDQLLGLVANLLKYKKNVLSKSRLFTFNEYVRTVFCYRYILLKAHYYVLFNKNKEINT